MIRYPMRVETINSTMSLRLPQYESLQVLDDLMRALDLAESVETLQKQVHDKYPIFREFEREFPSLCFVLATGVGKTILMGAFITYLYTNYGIKNFFLIAPNLTIYNKLIQDFGSPSYAKYVFKRVQPFVQNPPTVITGDTYSQYVAGQRAIQESITIHIFNIGKINAEVRSGALPQVKRLWEYIGESYFDYLKNLPDLVVLMDESHHYRADRGMAVINELNPLLGLELTATPQLETSKGPVKFKNVVYEYSLAKAITDGYVKEPAAATRRVFDPGQYTPDEIDHIKLLDGIRIHRNTQAELNRYAQNEGVRVVKPFVLVVCKDTVHAAETREYLESQAFYEGYYIGKVIEVHSAQKGSERDETIQKLLSLEDSANEIEIVVHVNMLKEGWDVTNLYTIIPLRTAVSLTLREQTIGRGLRLPYGGRTGNAAVDRLTIVAHDKFDEIIRAANDESSIIRRENIIVIEDDDDFGKEKEVVKSQTMFDDFIGQKEQNLKYARSPERKQALAEEIETARAVGEAIEEILSAPVNLVMGLPTAGTPPMEGASPLPPRGVGAVLTTRDLAKPEVRAAVAKLAEAKLEHGQLSMNPAALTKRVESAITPLVEQKIRFSIDIPDLVLMSKGPPTLTYEDFSLDTSFTLPFSTPSGEILIENLQDNQVAVLDADDGAQLADTPENLILAEVLEGDSRIDYDACSDLLYALVAQALDFVRSSKSEIDFIKTLGHYKKDVAELILTQLHRHMTLSEPEFEIKLLRAVSPLLQEDYTKFRADEVVRCMDRIPAYEIKKKVVGGFEKACHDKYKFDSVPEHDFAVVLERDPAVEKWLRPAARQFKIWWQGGREYQPDFLVETAGAVFIVEIKAHDRVKDDEVRLKEKAARAYCANVNALFSGTGRKAWRYLLIEDRDVSRKVTFGYLAEESERFAQG